LHKNEKKTSYRTHSVAYLWARVDRPILYRPIMQIGKIGKRFKKIIDYKDILKTFPYAYLDLSV